MDEAEQLCDRLVIMDRGRIAEQGSPAELIRRLSTREVVELRFPAEPPTVEPGTFDGLVARVEALPDRVLLYTDDGDALVPVAHERLHPQSVLVRRSTLEDVFLRLTGRMLVD
jgi:lipooligosaccharide transport system ATP-binding protein